MDSYIAKRAQLVELVKQAEISYEVDKLLAQRRGDKAPVRHKCFVSYHSADIDEVLKFVEQFNNVFIPRVIGVSDSDHFRDPINSNDEDYIKNEIGTRYLTDSSVTIIFNGRCTWSRKFVDWEVASTLRNSLNNKRSGLLAITPPDGTLHTHLARLADNLDKRGTGDCYARSYYYPTSEAGLRACIEDAFQARTARASLVKNSRALRTYNSSC